MLSRGVWEEPSWRSLISAFRKREAAPSRPRGLLDIRSNPFAAWNLTTKHCYKLIPTSALWPKSAHHFRTRVAERPVTNKAGSRAGTGCHQSSWTGGANRKT